jgi:predicted Fe-Mo cluster-binding NifX family protein
MDKEKLKMRIAIPSDDGITMSDHFGRCREFLVFDAGDGRAALVETRPNAGCHGGAGHGGFVESLRDCQVVLCGGIGAGALEALRVAGITAVRVNAAGPAEQIVASYRAGTVFPAASPSCQCRH